MASTVIPVVSAVLGTALAMAVVVGVRTAQQPQEEDRSAVSGKQPAEQQSLEEGFSAVFGDTPVDQEEDRSAVSGKQPAEQQPLEKDRSAVSGKQPAEQQSQEEDRSAVSGKQPAEQQSQEEDRSAVSGGQPVNNVDSVPIHQNLPPAVSGPVDQTSVPVHPSGGRDFREEQLFIGESLTEFKRRYPSWYAAFQKRDVTSTSDDDDVRYTAHQPLPPSVLPCATSKFVDPSKLTSDLSRLWNTAHDRRNISKLFADILQQQMVPMKPVEENPNAFTNAEAKVTLTKSNGTSFSGGFGEVTMSTLASPDGVTTVAVKSLIGKSKGKSLRLANDGKLMQEAIIQGVLWCIADAAKLTPNPIPELVLPMLEYDTAGNATAKVAMEDAGIPMLRWIETATPRQMWFALANLARALDVLGRAAGFTHGDMHLSNLTVLSTPEAQAITLGGDTFTEPLRVFIIDFGHACLTWPGGQLGPVSSNHAMFCRNTAGAADLAYVIFALLGKANDLRKDNPGGAAWKDTVWVLADVVMVIMKSAAASGKFRLSMPTLAEDLPHHWTLLDTKKHQDLFMNAAYANTLTTPAYVMELCRRQLLGLSRGH